MRFEEEVIAGGPQILPGAAELLAQVRAINSLSHPTTHIRLTYPMRFARAACNHVQLNSVPESKERWTIVTSATSFYAPLALKMAGIDSPPTIVTSEHVRYVCDFADSFNDALPTNRLCDRLPLYCASSAAANPSLIRTLKERSVVVLILGRHSS